MYICIHTYDTLLRTHWRLSKIFKANNKCVWSNVFWYVKMWKYLYSETLFNTLFIEIKQKCLKKFPDDKINVTKNALVFLSRAPTQHIFTFNLWFLYKLKHEIHRSKSMCGIFHFQFRLVFIEVYVFFKKIMNCLTLKNHNFFLNKNNRKATNSFAHIPLIFKLQQD